jgi:polycomb protein EED
MLITTRTHSYKSILDLKISPVDPTILASASIDHTIRIWSLDPVHKKQPVAAICYGQGHKEQVLTIAYHRKGRFILSAGSDTKIIMWKVPENLTEHTGTDKPAMVHYPHFSTTEVHNDFVDCVRWKIDGFSSDNANVPDPPIPTSNAIRSNTPVKIPANSTSGTRSAWGGRLQRLLQFDLPDSTFMYMRFSIFHELGRHPILVAGNVKSKAFFWDLQRLEDAGTGDDGSQANKSDLLGLPRHVREGTNSSDGSSAVSLASGLTKGKKRKKAKVPTPSHGIADPFMSIKAHKIVEVPKYLAFPFRQFGWSRDGQWCVGVGDSGLINVFHRWEKGVPPIETLSDVILPIR